MDLSSSSPALIATVTHKAEVMAPWDKKACVAIGCNSAAYTFKNVFSVLALQEIYPTQYSISAALAEFLVLAISERS